MDIIFGTTNNRKMEDIQLLINEMDLDIHVLSMKDIKWDRGEIEENGTTIEENSLIKAKALLSFCKDHNIEYPIMTDDSGLFVEALNGEPGIYTVRYADDELAKDSSLPPYQSVLKVFRKLEGKENRDAEFRCCVTTMMPNGKYHQEIGVSKGYIIDEIPKEFVSPYHYCAFALKKPNKIFNTLTNEELSNTFRHKALKKSLKRL